MFEQPFYHGSLRKVIISFGTLFSNIKIERKLTDSVRGDTIQTLNVPMSYSNKEKWLVRIEQDPTLENNVQISLPRIAFEITGYAYDSARKTNKMQKVKNDVGVNTRQSIFSPVPYNIDISLYVLSKTQEDNLQIIEQILPTFSPDYTLTIDAIPEMGIKQDIPVILNSVSVQDDYEGDFQTRRYVTSTLNFTLKINLFGPVLTSKIITHVIANISDKDTLQPYSRYDAIGNPVTELVTSESWVDFL